MYWGGTGVHWKVLGGYQVVLGVHWAVLVWLWCVVGGLWFTLCRDLLGGGALGDTGTHWDPVPPQEDLPAIPELSEELEIYRYCLGG